MRKTLLLSSLALVFGCSTGRTGAHITPGGKDGGVTTTGGDSGVAQGPPVTPNCDANGAADADQDGDGYTPAQGDCNDCSPSINPGAIQVVGDPTDYACNGMPGVVATCDTSLDAKTDATSMANAMDLCDTRFLVSAAFVGPSEVKARRVEADYGVIKPRAGAGMSLVSNGIAADKNDANFDTQNEEDPGTAFADSNTYANPLPNLPGAAGCSQTQPGTVNDYTELVLKLKAPTNANSFSFDFQFFSAEYPTYVCTSFNDEFLVLQESSGFTTPTNIAFDNQKNAVTINSGFFTVCTNDPSKPQTQHCTAPVSGISGTGFEDAPGGAFGLGGIPGGSTGWLTTTSPVVPGETVTLHFIIFDEGDHILDSASLIDNFRWGTTVVTTPTTAPIF